MVRALGDIFTGSCPRRGSQASWQPHTPPPAAEQPPCSRPSHQGYPETFPIQYHPEQMD